MAETVKVKPSDMQFDELMLKVRNGQIRIPDFQREFVWDRNQILSLLDSVYRHFPIGSFLFWQTEDEIQSYRKIGEIELRHDPGRSIQYVLDGQQRLTALFASLEQAEIAHRVNGRKVTKPLEVYFDLDKRKFVADPFTDKSKTVATKYMTLPCFTDKEGHLGVLEDLVQYIRKEKRTNKEVKQWVMSRLEVGPSRANQLHKLFQTLGMYEVSDGICEAGRTGQELITSPSAKPVVRELVQTIRYTDRILPRLAASGEGSESDLVDLLENELGQEVKPYHVRGRLKWLAGLGLGTFQQKKLTLTPDGTEMIRDVLREFEIRERDFREREADKTKRYFSVRQITDMEKFVEAHSVLDQRRKKALLEVRKRFESYPFSVIDIFDQPIETACEIFERINNSGQILSVVDLMVAKSWSPTFNLRERLAAFREELKREHYDSIPDITILQCVAGVIQKSVQRKEILGIEKGEVEANWESTLESLRLALDFLRSNLRITLSKLLPYNSILVPLTCFFHAAKQRHLNEEQRGLLVQWFWRVSISNRYDSAVETKLGDDIAEMEKLAAGEEPGFLYVAPNLSSERITEQRLDLGSAFCKTILCVLNSREPLELKDGSPVLLTNFSKFNSAELHHIFPKAYLKRHAPQHYAQRDSIANIAIARASANKSYSNKAPSNYLQHLANPHSGRTLSSHLVEDLDASGILTDDFMSFIHYRAGRILDEMRRLSGHMTEVEADFRGSEAGAIEKFELRMRTLLDTRLKAENPDYWSHTGSLEFRNRIEDRIKAWLRENPSRERNEAREVDFCQILEYLKIAKAHWTKLEPVFQSRSNLEMHLKNVSNFRNGLMHNREIDVTTRQLALGSLHWFDEVFKALDEQPDDTQ